MAIQDGDKLAKINPILKNQILTLVSQITDPVWFIIIIFLIPACMSYSRLLFIAENPLYIYLFFGLLYPALCLLGTIGYLGHSSTMRSVNDAAIKNLLESCRIIGRPD